MVEWIDETRLLRKRRVDRVQRWIRVLLLLLLWMMMPVLQVILQYEERRCWLNLLKCPPVCGVLRDGWLLTLSLHYRDSKENRLAAYT